MQPTVILCTLLVVSLTQLVRATVNAVPGNSAPSSMIQSANSTAVNITNNGSAIIQANDTLIFEKTNSAEQDNLLQLFNQFIVANNKDYKSKDEYNYRFNIFKEQLAKMIDSKKPLSDQVSIEGSIETSTSTNIIVNQGVNPCIFMRNLNKFADLSDEEFQRYYLLPQKFFDEKKYQPKSVLSLSDESAEVEEIKLKLNDENYDIFTDALVRYQSLDQPNKIQPEAIEGMSANIKQPLLKLFQPKSGIFRDAKAKETGLTDVCISYMIKSETKISSKVQIPNGTITRKTTRKTTVSFSKLISSNPSISDVFPTRRRLQSFSSFFNWGRRPNSNGYEIFSDNRKISSSRFRKNGFNNFGNRINGLFQPSFREPNRLFFDESFNEGRQSQEKSSASYENRPQTNSNKEDDVLAEIKQAAEISLGGVKVPTYLDWRDAGIITPIKDQKKCKGCYAFSSIAAVEANNALFNSKIELLSEQEILDCSFENDGCEGGLPSLVFDYIKSNGISTEQDYPFKSLPNKDFCDRSSSTIKFRNISGHVVVKKGVVSLIKALQFGPVATISYSAPEFKFYYKGIYDGEGCEGAMSPNHSSLLVGYNLQSPKPYFILKNAWGEHWGERGFYKMSIGPLTDSNLGKCLIASTNYNAYPVILKVSS